jgi:hypothetical protein
MKNKRFLLKTTLILLAIFFSMQSCRKEEIVANEDDAADAIETALVKSSGGTSEDIAANAAFTSESVNDLNCTVQFDTSVTFVNSGIAVTSFSHAWSVLLNCNGANPESITWSGTYNGNFDAPRIKGNCTGSRNWTITGLDAVNTNYNLNGTTSRSGTHTSKVRNNYEFSNTINFSLTNLTVDKTTYRIIGGTATVQATLSVSNGSSKTFNGNIVFNGNGTATLTINGNTYTISIY